MIKDAEQIFDLLDSMVEIWEDNVVKVVKMVFLILWHLERWERRIEQIYFGPLVQLTARFNS